MMVALCRDNVIECDLLQGSGTLVHDGCSVLIALEI